MPMPSSMDSRVRRNDEGLGDSDVAGAQVTVPDSCAARVHHITIVHGFPRSRE